MVAWFWPLAVLVLSALVVGLGWLLLRPRDTSDRTVLELPGGFLPRGRIRIAGDVVVRGMGRAGRMTELDVPTRDVDSVLEAFRFAGFDARDTGLTVDTDDGEEALTTVHLGLQGLTRSRAGPEDLLAVDGDLTVEPGAYVACTVRAGGAVHIGDDVYVDGSIHAGGRVEVGRGTRIRGLVSGGDVRIGPACHAHGVVARRDVHVADADTETLGRIRARRVRLDALATRP